MGDFCLVIRRLACAVKQISWSFDNWITPLKINVSMCALIKKTQFYLCCINRTMQIVAFFHNLIWEVINSRYIQRRSHHLVAPLRSKIADRILHEYHSSDWYQNNERNVKTNWPIQEGIKNAAWLNQLQSKTYRNLGNKRLFSPSTAQSFDWTMPQYFWLVGSG